MRVCVCVCVARKLFFSPCRLGFPVRAFLQETVISRRLHHHMGAPACAEQSVAKRRPQPPAWCVRVLVFVFVKKGREKKNVRAVEHSKMSECVSVFVCVCVCGGG